MERANDPKTPHQPPNPIVVIVLNTLLDKIPLRATKLTTFFAPAFSILTVPLPLSVSAAKVLLPKKGISIFGTAKLVKEYNPKNTNAASSSPTLPMMGIRPPCWISTVKARILAKVVKALYTWNAHNMNLGWFLNGYPLMSGTTGKTRQDASGKLPFLDFEEAINQAEENRFANVSDDRSDWVKISSSLSGKRAEMVKVINWRVAIIGQTRKTKLAGVTSVGKVEANCALVVDPTVRTSTCDTRDNVVSDVAAAAAGTLTLDAAAIGPMLIMDAIDINPKYARERKAGAWLAIRIMRDKTYLSMTRSAKDTLLENFVTGHLDSSGALDESDREVVVDDNDILDFSGWIWWWW
jgi:hypothetical protein